MCPLQERCLKHVAKANGRIMVVNDYAAAWFEARIPHDYARRARYVTGNIEAELQAKLAR